MCRVAEIFRRYPHTLRSDRLRTQRVRKQQDAESIRILYPYCRGLEKLHWNNDTMQKALALASKLTKRRVRLQVASTVNRNLFRLMYRYTWRAG